MPIARLKAWPFCRFASWAIPSCTPPPSPVDEITDEIRTLVADMFETMDAAPGVGSRRAAGRGRRCGSTRTRTRTTTGAPWRGVIINPELWMRPLEPGEPDPDDESEGCLSFPGERFPLRRSEAVLVTGTDLEGAPVRIEVDGWRARIMQHEFDHLDGVLYVDRLGDGDWKTVQKIARKRGWGRPGQAWTPGIDDLEP